MSDHYITLESKLNDRTIDELDMHEANPHYVVVNKVLNDAVEPNPAITRAINKFANEICLIETKRRLNNNPEAKGIHYSKQRDRYVAVRYIAGKRIHIKSHKDRSIVEAAYYKYLEDNGLKK